MQNKGFLDALKRDSAYVFLDLDTFGRTGTIRRNGEEFEGVDYVLSREKDQVRSRRRVNDYAQGMFSQYVILTCAEGSLGVDMPEVGERIEIREGENSLYQRFSVRASSLEFGIMRLELGGHDE